MKERRWVLFAVLALLLAGCGGDEPDPATVSNWDQMAWDQGQWQ